MGPKKGYDKMTETEHEILKLKQRITALEEAVKPKCQTCNDSKSVGYRDIGGDIETAPCPDCTPKPCEHEYSLKDLRHYTGNCIKCGEAPKPTAKTLEDKLDDSYVKAVCKMVTMKSDDNVRTWIANEAVQIATEHFKELFDGACQKITSNGEYRDGRSFETSPIAKELKNLIFRKDKP